MKKLTFTIVAAGLGVALIKFFWLVLGITVVLLAIGFTTKAFKKTKKPKDKYKKMWKPWSDR